MKNGQTVAKRPMRRLLTWPEDIQRYFDRRMREFGLRPTGMLRPKMAGEWLPDADIFQRGQSMVLKMDLPGLRAEDIEVTVEGDTLVVRGHREEETEVKEEDYYCSERASGEFFRTFRLPDNAKAEGITAACKDGVLEVTFPLTGETKPESIHVEVKPDTSQ